MPSVNQQPEKQTFGIEKGKPLVLPSGTVVRKDRDGKTTLETKTEQEERAEIEKALSDPFIAAAEAFQRTLADVTVTPKQFNPVMLVLSYTLWGLDSYAISRFLELSEEQVDDIKNSDLFVKTRKQTLEAIRYAEASTIHGYLSDKARKAAIVVASQLTSNDADTAMAAAKDILDRSGYRPIDRVEHSHRFEDELRIVHLRESEEVNMDVGV